MLTRRNATGLLAAALFAGALPDLAGREGPMVELFKDPAYFDRVFLEMGALTWPNGYDWSPEALHADMAAAGALSQEPAVA